MVFPYMLEAKERERGLRTGISAAGLGSGAGL